MDKMEITRKKAALYEELKSLRGLRPSNDRGQEIMEKLFTLAMRERIGQTVRVVWETPKTKAKGVGKGSSGTLKAIGQRFATVKFDGIGEVKIPMGHLLPEGVSEGFHLQKPDAN
jgi:hypothetical protein